MITKKVRGFQLPDNFLVQANKPLRSYDSIREWDELGIPLLTYVEKSNGFIYTGYWGGREFLRRWKRCLSNENMV